MFRASKEYWLKAAVDARDIAKTAPNPRAWHKLADLYQELSEVEFAATTGADITSASEGT